MNHRQCIGVVIAAILCCYLGFVFGMLCGKRITENEILSGYRVQATYQTNNLGEVKIINRKMIK